MEGDLLVDLHVSGIPDSHMRAILFVKSTGKCPQHPMKQRLCASLPFSSPVADVPAKSQLCLLPELLLPAALVIVITLFSGILCKLMKNECSKEKSCCCENWVKCFGNTLWKQALEIISISCKPMDCELVGEKTLRNLERLCSQNHSYMPWHSHPTLSKIRAETAEKKKKGLANVSWKRPDCLSFTVCRPQGFHHNHTVLPLSQRSSHRKHEQGRLWSCKEQAVGPELARLCWGVNCSWGLFGKCNSFPSTLSPLPSINLFNERPFEGWGSRGEEKFHSLAHHSNTPNSQYGLSQTELTHTTHVVGPSSASSRSLHTQRAWTGTRAGTPMQSSQEVLWLLCQQPTPKDISMSLWKQCLPLKGLKSQLPSLFLK